MTDAGDGVRVHACYMHAGDMHAGDMHAGDMYAGDMYASNMYAGDICMQVLCSCMVTDAGDGVRVHACSLYNTCSLYNQSERNDSSSILAMGI